MNRFSIISALILVLISACSSSGKRDVASSSHGEKVNLEKPEKQETHGSQRPSQELNIQCKEDADVSSSDYAKLASFFTEANEGKSNHADLYDKYIANLSNAGKQFFVRRMTLLQMTKGFDALNAPDIKNEVEKFALLLGQREQQRIEYRKAGILSRTLSDPDKKFMESADLLSRQGTSLVNLIKKSKFLDPLQKSVLSEQILVNLKNEFGEDGRIAESFANRYAAYAKTAEVTQNLSIGAGMLVLGMATFGSTSSLGAGYTAAALSVSVKAMAGYSMGKGYGLARGNLGIGFRGWLRARHDGTSIACEIANEQEAYGDEVLKNATHLGYRAAALSASFGIGTAIPKAKAVTLWATTLLSGTALAATTYHTIHNSVDSRKFFLEAEKSAMMGDYDLARQHLENGRSHAISAGLSTIDAAFATLASIKSIGALRAELAKGKAIMMNPEGGGATGGQETSHGSSDGGHGHGDHFDPPVVDDATGVILRRKPH